MRLAALLVPMFVASCGAGEQEARDGGLVVRLPADWVAARAERAASWSGPRGTADWRTTVNLHWAPVSTDEVTRSVDGVAKALLVEYAHLGAQTRLVRGERLGGREAVRLDVRFEHEGQRYRRRQFVVRHGDRIVHLDATAPAASWDRVEPVLERAVETARWEDS